MEPDRILSRKQSQSLLPSFGAHCPRRPGIPQENADSFGERNGVTGWEMTTLHSVGDEFAISRNRRNDGWQARRHVFDYGVGQALRFRAVDSDIKRLQERRNRFDAAGEFDGAIQAKFLTPGFEPTA
jgi:hypothetical protein